ncbi:DUF1937 family protein [Nodosilinea nodulosa]|uniref:DUF1937 family protein n=1 Tax=Nodosilinea nodulosa TaxID=416001 RepID=UPI0008FB7626|nr:DUF1937 family protein [Nodosilinea nodulosa]
MKNMPLVSSPYLSRQKTIFVSSPYTQGDSLQNVILQIKAQHHLMDMGYIPFVPLLSHFSDEIRGRPYEEWMSWCLAWLDRCDALVRLDSEYSSSGADREQAYADLKGIPVFLGLDAVPDPLEIRSRLPL